MSTKAQDSIAEATKYLDHRRTTDAKDSYNATDGLMSAA